MLLHRLKSWRVVLWSGAGQVVGDLGGPMKGRLNFSWELGRSPAGWETGQGLVLQSHIPGWDGWRAGQRGRGVGIC